MKHGRQARSGAAVALDLTEILGCWDLAGLVRLSSNRLQRLGLFKVLTVITRIAFIIPSLSSGGAERVVATLAGALRQDFETHIFIQPDTTRHYELKGVTLHELAFTAEALGAAISRLKIDLVLDHYHWDKDHIRLMAALADDGVQIVLTEHNAYHYPMFQWARDRKEGYQDWFTERYDHYRRFAGVTVLNEDARAAFSAHLDNVRTVLNPLPYATRGRAHPTEPTVLNVSHFRKRAKRLDLLYASVGKLQQTLAEARLTILGDYDWLEDAWMRQAYGVNPDRISCVGRTQRVGDYYERATAFALTSEIEGQPMVLLEAAMHGVPQVAFDLPGLRDQIIDGETGFLVPFGDTDAFADRLERLLTAPKLVETMGSASRAFVSEHFSIERIRQHWLSIIAEIDSAGRLTSAVNPGSALAAQRDLEWIDHWHNVANRGDIVTPKISFIVPVYGTEELLGRCLRSIQDQTLEEFECIVVDDASPGDPAAVMEQVVGSDGRFCLVRHDENRGLYQARSTGAGLARGLYLAHVDSDDYIDTRFAAVMFAEAVTTGSEIVECQAVELHPNGRPIRFNTITRDGPVDGAEANRAFVNNSLRNVVWNKIYARDLWNRVPDHNEIDIGLSICEDLLRNSLLFPHCRRYSSVRDCLYHYCRRPTSVVKGGDMTRLLAKLKDVDFSYSIAIQEQTGPGVEALTDRLEERRAEDIAWYIGEYAARTDPRKARAELRAHKDEIDDSFAALLLLAGRHERLQTEYRNRTQSWLWEKNRADGLQHRLQTLQPTSGT